MNGFVEKILMTHFGDLMLIYGELWTAISPFVDQLDYEDYKSKLIDVYDATTAVLSTFNDKSQAIVDSFGGQLPPAVEQMIRANLKQEFATILADIRNIKSTANGIEVVELLIQYAHEVVDRFSNFAI